MRIAGLIHDIGKIGVDEKILNKPGRLILEERRDIERHPEIGWKILSSTIDFSELTQFDPPIVEVFVNRVLVETRDYR